MTSLPHDTGTLTLLFQLLVIGVGIIAFGLRRRNKLPEEEMRRKIGEHLEIVGMQGTEEKMPAELSGGMRKRVGIARALILNPDIMLYDEPTAGLDPIMASVIDNLIVRLCDEFGITLLLNTQDHYLPMAPVDIASWAYQAEVVEFNEPGGMMDHYTSALGGLLYIDCRPPISVQPLPAELDGFVLGESLVPKETTETLRESRETVAVGRDVLRQRLPDFDFRTTPLEQAQPFFDEMPAGVRRRIKAQFINRNVCQQARDLLSQPTVDHQRLGELLLEHQRQLRDGIGVSHPKLDALIEASMEAGALGGKLNGSGCGGAMFAHAPGRQQEVKQAIDAAGGRGHIVSVRGGVTVRIDGA